MYEFQLLCIFANTSIDSVFNFSSSYIEYVVVVVYCGFNLYCTRVTDDVEHFHIQLLVIYISHL